METTISPATERERFLATMRYEPRDRSPICDFGFWDETIVVWHEQGLPEHVKQWETDPWFGMESYGRYPAVHAGLFPAFEHKVLEDRGEYQVTRDWEGVISLGKKFMGSIPMHLGHTLVDRESWRTEFLWRLDPDNPERFPEGWEERVRALAQQTPEAPLALPGGSLFGWIRNWMGLENAATTVYDDPAWFEEMVETVAILIESVLAKLIETGVQFDVCGMWEDMCYSGGPLLSPAHFEQFLVPRYRRITERLAKAGVGVVYVDCDGCIDQLIPLWLGAGVNCMFPIEVGTWGADPIAMRREFGRDLLLMGGFDKRILARGRDAIDAEIARLTPLVEEGGYIPFCDHRVPPDVSYANYLYYLGQARHVWGKDRNLKPSPALEAFDDA